MLALLPNSPAVVPPHLLDPSRVGFLLSPIATRRTHQTTLSRFCWAADNEMYAAWKMGRAFDWERFYRFVKSIQGYPGRCLFIVVPDVPTDHEATTRQYRQYAPRLREFGLPLAYAAQDGLDQIPDNLDYDTLFIGGTNEYRFSGLLPEVVRQAKQSGKWVHYGRANTRLGIEIAARLGCDSFDGTRSAIDMKELRPILAWSEALTHQTRMF